MQPSLTVDIEQMSTAERIELAEYLWDSILANPESLSVTEAQKQALDSRLERHREAPNEVMSWQDIKNRLSGLE